MNNKQWFIAGQGSVGSFIAYNALLSSLKYHQIVRKPFSPTNTAPQVHPLNGVPVSLPNAIALSDIKLKSIEYLIVPLKAYDIIPFLTQVQPFLNDNAAIILCHNGLGTIELATNLISENMDLYFCTTSNGLYKNSQGIFQAGIGDSLWSHVSGSHPQKLNNDDLIPLFNRIDNVNNLQQILWQKLIINCAINPLTAIHKVKNGELLQDKYRTTITAVVDESLAVATAFGVSLKSGAVLTKVYQVINDTANNYSSMYQDIHSNKQNEIDFITGHIIKLGADFNIPTPVSDNLYQQIKSFYK
jgi:2-dehydropantoate 2-reductase